jgi:hypothetical protein
MEDLDKDTAAGTDEMNDGDMEVLRISKRNLPI